MQSQRPVGPCFERLQAQQAQPPPAVTFENSNFHAEYALCPWRLPTSAAHPLGGRSAREIGRVSLPVYSEKHGLISEDQVPRARLPRYVLLRGQSTSLYTYGHWCRGARAVDCAHGPARRSSPRGARRSVPLQARQLRAAFDDRGRRGQPAGGRVPVRAVVGVQRSRGELARWYTIGDPHVIHLDAAPDNEREPLDLPLAPWY